MKNSIAERRNVVGLTQEALAGIVGISRPHLSEIENNKAEPGGEFMLKIARALQANVEMIFFADDVVCTQLDEDIQTPA